MQRRADVEGKLLVLSYVPTAACIGMAHLLKVRRIVWEDAQGARHSVNLSNPNVEILGAEAIVFQADRTNYNPIPILPNFPRVLARYTHLVPDKFLPPNGTADLIRSLQGADDTVRNNAGLLLAFAIAAVGHGPLQAPNPNRSRNYLGQNIASVLVDSNYKILRWGINTNAEHQSLHGETNIIRSFQASNNSALPNGGKLFTTLEPCAMCSGMIVHTAGMGNDFEVISGQRDMQVNFSALRNNQQFDGYVINQARSVTSIISKIPLLLRPQAQPVQNFDNYMNTAQTKNTPPPNHNQEFRLMQTTRYLEQHAGPVMSDAAKILDKMAALWLPAAQRSAWRASRDEFLLHVQAIIRS